MSYAVRVDGLGFRAVDSESDCQAGERWQLNQPAVVESAVPQTVTRFQAMAALQMAGKLGEVIDYMEQPATDELAKLAWYEVLNFNRSSLLVMNVAVILGFSSKDVDDLFIAASSIEV